MTASNTAPAWRRAFLRELARSGSVALAAQKCGIDRSSAYQVRRRNPGFAASWDRAVEAARARLAAAEECGSQAHPQPLPQAGGESAEQPVAFPQAGGESAEQPVALPQEGGESAEQPVALRQAGGESAEQPVALRQAGGESLAQQVPLPLAGGVRGGPRLRGDEIVRTSKHGRPCIMRAGPGRWSVRAERAFLAELTATANVAAAARAAGVSTVAVYNRRRNSPAFAAAWAAAKAEGYERIEMLLLHAATATLDPAPAVEGREAPPMNVDQAMNLFKLHRASQLGGKPQRYGWRHRVPDIEDVRASILRKIEAIERAEARKTGPAAGPQ